MPEPAVQVEQLTKIYRVYSSPWDRLREALLRQPRHREFRALSGVSFSLPKGEGLAIIGENGAGKSTLLKLLAGIGVPTSGAVRVHGKVASILELGSGFHPEFTGRQNIVLNAAMLGLSEQELQQRLPSIIAWSELGDFIDQPVKVYSTGMAMRLGFSIAIQVEPDVLIIDEALSVGDGYFQKKCMDRLLQFVGSGGTLLFCSHAMYYVSAFCQRALWLRQGRAEALGPVADVVRDYENFLLAKSAPGDRAASATAGGRAAGAAEEGGAAGALAGEGAGGREEAAAGDLPRRPARLLGVRVSGGASAEAPTGTVPLFAPGDSLEIEVEFESQSRDLAFHVGIGVNRIDDLEVCSLATHLDGRPPMTGRTHYRISAVLPRLTLVKGEFTLYVFLLDESGLHIYDQRIYRRAFGVHSTGYSFGVVTHDHRWQEPADRRAAANPEAPTAPVAAAGPASAPAAAAATAADPGTEATAPAPAIAGRG
jgi:ABC-type polysaccharide/polyol phosphate transport system ATPase subunit